MKIDYQYWQRGHDVLGVDEAGRGPMAGPCVVASVMFPKGFYDDRIDDSKKLSLKQRKELVNFIKSESVHYSIDVIDVQTIDKLNIYRACQRSFTDLALLQSEAIILTDAMPLTDDTLNWESIVKGDQKSISIAAASILAKTYRDDLMIAYDRIYPEYGFKNHKGYGTKKHKEAILKFGRCPIHRKSFKFKDELQVSFDI